MYIYNRERLRHRGREGNIHYGPVYVRCCTWIILCFTKKKKKESYSKSFTNGQ